MIHVQIQFFENYGMYILIDFSLYSLIIDEQGVHFQTGANESLFKKKGRHLT